MIEIGTRVLIISDCNSKGKYGTVISTYKAGYCGQLDYVGVKLDNGTRRGYNELSVEVIEEEKNRMKGFNKIAIVNLLDDYNKKDYGFALYDSELEYMGDWKMSCIGSMVIVNPRVKDNRVLGIIKEIVPTEEYSGKSVTAQVVGVVNMDGYNARVAEEKRREEIKKQKISIEKELKTRLDKLKDAEYYEQMAKTYAEKDPELVKLVEQLKELGE